MSPHQFPVKWSWFLIVLVIIGALSVWGASRLNVETDILASMPHSDPALDSARHVIGHLPIQDKIFIDLAQSSADRRQLVDAAHLVTDELEKSGLFRKVGLAGEAGLFGELLIHVQGQLPLLLSADELKEKIAPLLTPEKIREAMAQNRQALEQLDGIGRAGMITSDPLGLSQVVLSKMSSLAPTQGAQFHSGQLLSADGRHALILAHINQSGTDTTFAARIETLLEQCRQRLAAAENLPDDHTLTSVGAYRAALDNETIAKRDTRLAVVLTTLAIALLLIFTFPRPLIGLLALIPSLFGTVTALLVCSFVFNSISMLAVGFGGAIMAFTVDLGLTYLLFLDQPRKTHGAQVSRELWTAELLSVLTTLGAFLLLTISDFKILAQIGVFAALGATFALLFVHFIFPKIFPSMPPAKRTTNRYLLSAIRNIAAPARWKLIGALIFGLIMLLFAKPVFQVDLSAMNSVRPETLAAEKTLQDVWGNLSGQSYVLLEAPTLEVLSEKNERLRIRLDDEAARGRIATVFLPSDLFPSRAVAQRNLLAWQNFWSPKRLAEVKKHLDAAAQEFGFIPEAFEPFWQRFAAAPIMAEPIPESYFDMLGLSKTSEGFTELVRITPGPSYRPDAFLKRISEGGLAHLFDAEFFNLKLSAFMKMIFLEIALIVSIGIVGVVFLFFLEWRLSLAVLAPIVFALVSTLGTLKLLGHPLDIPGIMLWIVVMGMGIDYAIYYVCTYQRYPDHCAPQMDTIRLSVFLAAATTFTGFGVLALAQHALLRSIGLVSLFGIGYSLLGAYFILPTLVQKIFAPYRFPEGAVEPGSPEHRRRVNLRYRLLPGHPRLFARCKMKMDPMFSELDQYVKNPRRIIDIGCGFGVPATWLLELYPHAEVFGLEPDEERVLIANRVIGLRGGAQVGGAPDLPQVEGAVDYVLMLDMLHLIDDDETRLVFGRIFDKLETGGTLLVRATVPTRRKVPWKRWVEAARLKMSGMRDRFRAEGEIAALLSDAGFATGVYTSPTPGVEEKWFVGKKQPTV